MSEVENEVLEKFKKAIAKEDSVSPELVKALSAELSKESPNAELLADIIKLKKAAVPND